MISTHLNVERLTAILTEVTRRAPINHMEKLDDRLLKLITQPIL